MKNKVAKLIVVWCFLLFVFNVNARGRYTMDWTKEIRYEPIENNPWYYYKLLNFNNNILLLTRNSINKGIIFLYDNEGNVIKKVEDADTSFNDAIVYDKNLYVIASSGENEVAKLIKFDSSLNRIKTKEISEINNTNYNDYPSVIASTKMKIESSMYILNNNIYTWFYGNTSNSTPKILKIDIGLDHYEILDGTENLMKSISEKLFICKYEDSTDDEGRQKVIYNISSYGNIIAVTGSALDLNDSDNDAGFFEIRDGDEVISYLAESDVRFRSVKIFNDVILVTKIDNSNQENAVEVYDLSGDYLYTLNSNESREDDEIDYGLSGIYIFDRTDKEVFLIERHDAALPGGSPYFYYHNLVTYYLPVKINIEDSDNGRILVEETNVKSGDTIMISTSPSSGYKLSSVSIKDTNDNIIDLANNRFTMPYDDVNIKGVFVSDGSQNNGEDQPNNNNNNNNNNNASDDGEKKNPETGSFIKISYLLPAIIFFIVIIKYSSLNKHFYK